MDINPIVPKALLSARKLTGALRLGERITQTDLDRIDLELRSAIEAVDRIPQARTVAAG